MVGSVLMRPARTRRSTADGPVDLRSDTVTRPTKRMREAMVAAEVDDDVLGHDPTMRELENRVAALLGTDDAVWTPSGSMANLIALMSHLQRGDAFLAPAGAHVLDAELGTAAWLAGGMPRPLPHDAGPGKVSPEAVRRAAGSAGPYYTLRTTLLCLENTHNAAGGTVTAPDEHAAVAAAARAAGLRVHLDGARLWHAAVALGVPPATLTVGADTVQVCFSKGLGAPVGSALCGNRDFITRARRIRKMAGGGMRQAGVLAAAGLYALDHHLPRLGEDHEHAQLLAKRLGVDPSSVETNMVVLDDVAAPVIAEAAKAQGVLVSQVSARRIRLVLHLDVDRAAVDRAADVLAELLDR